jgi:peptidyl-prolyl cis-trans isomerase C
MTSPSLPSSAPIARARQRRGGLRASLAAALLAAATATACAQATDDPVLAKVNGVEIRQSDVALAEEDVGPNVPAPTEEAKRDYLIAYLTDMILLAKDAEAKKVQDSAEFKRRLAFSRNKVLMDSALKGAGKDAITDQSLHAVYDEAVKQMGEEQEVHARHILFRSPENDEAAGKQAEEKAKATLVRVKKGEDFGALASELSEDPGTKASGGDLGYFAKDQMVPEFATVAFQLDKGQVSDPVKTAFGWHIIKVEDKRKREVPGFDQVRGQLESYVTRKAQVELVNKLRAEAKIERLDKPAAPAPAPAEEKK